MRTTELQPVRAAYPGLSDVGPTYLSASRSGPADAQCVRIGGHLIQIRFATPGLLPCIMPAFAHLGVDSQAPPELVVHVWDSASTGASAPPMPDVGLDTTVGAFYFFEADSVRGVFQPGLQALTVVDFGADHAWYFVENPAALPYWERAAPIRQILHWWMATRGHQQVHGGAVGSPDGGVLLVGKPGSGKSTTALISLTTELRYAGDDYSMVSLLPRPLVHSLYSSGKVHPENLPRLPHITPALWNAGELATEKGVVFVDQHFPDRMIESFPLRAIVLPTITGKPETRVVETSRGASLAALAPSTVFQLHTAGADALRYMARLVREVPSYVLELGTNVTDVPGVLLQLLDDLRRAQE